MSRGSTIVGPERSNCITCDDRMNLRKADVGHRRIWVSVPPRVLLDWRLDLAGSLVLWRRHR
jgi:hypothetical protein